MIVASWYPEGGIVPPEIWWLIADLGVLVAFGAFLVFLGWCWDSGPGWLIDHGPEWWTSIGEWWSSRRQAKKE